MAILAAVLVVLVAVVHVGFWILEAALWKTPRGRAIFETTPEEAARMAPLAANQGLYNGFIAAGLIWGLVLSGWAGFQFRVAFLVFAIIAGVYGCITVSRRIIVLQALPAALALAAVVAAR